ncbi:hypothetical protein WN944_008210 [Citrus x changshan-huyou]|uniref:Uncharacterized protein n=1 Tax=Citrus x changshan-huyou TaxID=2935761 RepID=A0AAP0MPZ4_9ROSI
MVLNFLWLTYRWFYICSVLVMSYRMLSLTRGTHNSTNGVSHHQERISTQTCNDRRTRNHTQFITETNVLYGQNHTHRFSIKYANVVYKAKIRSKVPQKDAEKLMRTLLTQDSLPFATGYKAMILKMYFNID